MIQRFLLLWLSLLSLIAFFWPKPFVITEPALKAIFAVAMFSVGALLPKDEVSQIFKKWPTVLAGTAVQYTVMPLLAWLMVSTLPFSPGMQVGIILTGCVPGAMASNILTHKARGNVSYSISLTTSATLLSPLIVPWVLWWFLREQIPLNPVDILIDLLWTVVGPVILGHGLCRFSKSMNVAMSFVGVTVANLAILWIVATVVALNQARLSHISIDLIFYLLLLNVLGYSAGYLSGKILNFPEGNRRALTLEVGMQNAGLGAVLAIKYFSVLPEAAIAPAAYTFGCMLTGTILAHLWASKSKTQEDQTLNPATQES